MKKILTLVLGLTMMAACSSDDDGSSTVDNSKITKKWYHNSTIIFGQEFPYDDHEECGKDYVEFLVNGTFKDVDVWDCELDVETVTWKLEGSKLTLVFPDGSKELIVSKLTETVLEVTHQEDYDGDGAEETVISTFTNN